MGTGDRMPWRVVSTYEDHEGSGILWFFPFMNRKKLEQKARKPVRQSIKAVMRGLN